MILTSFANGLFLLIELRNLGPIGSIKVVLLKGFSKVLDQEEAIFLLDKL